MQDITVGDRIRFTPGSRPRNWWTVRARSERFIVATRYAAFHPKGTLEYTVVDLTGWRDKFYNGQGRGIVRSSLDIIGGGWGNGTYDDTECAEILEAVVSGEWGLSHRRVLSVQAIERYQPMSEAQYQPH